MPASWNSYSKSDTARSPRSTTRAPCWRTNSISRPLKPTTCTLLMPASTSRAISTRSASGKKVRFAGLSATPMMSESNSVLARRTRSSWPRVSGSNVPGYTALIIASPFEELVAHLPGARALQFAPTQPRLCRGRGFDVHPRRFCYPIFKLREERRQRILPDRGVEENHVEPLARVHQILSCIAAHQLDRARADLVARRLQRRKSRAVVFDHHHARRAARSRLEAERAAAGKKIEATLAIQPLSEPVEERLAHAVGRRAQARPRRHLDAPAAILARDDADFPFVRMHSTMVAALSWAARLKNGLARTREVLNTPVSELFARRRVDESLFEDLETALLQADCGVPATQWLLTALREKARSQRIEDGETLKRALKDSLTELLAPLEKRLDVSRAKPYVLMIAGVNGSGNA